MALQRDLQFSWGGITVGDEVLPDALGGEACVLNTVEYRMCLFKACFAVWVVAFMGT